MSLTHALTSTSVATLNWGGRLLRGIGISSAPLSYETVVAAARRRAGLEDFGEIPVEEPLRRLVNAYEREARLSTVGRIAVREMLVSAVECVLFLARDRAESADIERETITAPVIITGLPRTGSTLLHNLLALDPESRAPLTWEVMFPAGFSRGDVGRIRRRTNSRLAWANRLAPGFERAHEMDADLPQECIAIMAQGLQSIQFHTTHRLPSYQDWFETESQSAAYDFHYRFLQHLQSRGGRKRWVLKAPGHLFGIDALLARYPDARIVQAHRNPLEVMASIASLATTLRRAFSDSADPREIAADWCPRWMAALFKALDTRDRHSANTFFDVSYAELATNPLAVVEQIYSFLGWSLSTDTRASMQDFLEGNPKDKHGAHRYALVDFGLDEMLLKRRFRAYCERFDISVDRPG